MKVPRCSVGIIVFMVLLLGLPLDASATDVRVLYSLLDGVYGSHVDDGYVNYPSLARNTRFHKYLTAIEDFDVDGLESDEARLVFWINAYNALAIKSIIEGITPINAIGRLKFFRTTEHRVAGRKLDLQSIAAIVNKLGNFKAHFALVAACYACPRLRSEAYRVATLEQQLEKDARGFINDRLKNRFSTASRKAYLSELFERNRSDFGESDEALLGFITPYMEREAVAKEVILYRYEIEFKEWDWSINGRPM